MDAHFLDKTRVRAAFNRAANTYDGAAVVQAMVRDEMLSRLDLVKLSPQIILDAGCGTGLGSRMLQQRFGGATIVSLDMAINMLHKTRTNQPFLKRMFSQPSLLCADIEALPLVENSVGLIWSNLALQWCNDLDAAFGACFNSLQPEGLLMFSTFGPDTLKELRIASSADANTHVSRFIDMHDIGDALVRAGFNAPVLDVERYTLTYDDVKAVMKDLKSIGAHNATQGRQRGLAGKGFLQNLTQQYEQFRVGGKLPATFEVVFGHAWKPQPKINLGEGVSPMIFKPRK